MNQIPKRQNEQKQLERLAAQRELYSAAKRWHEKQIIFTVPIPIMLATASLFYSDLAVWAAVYGFLAFIIDILIFEPQIHSRKTKAAKIQELFDCDVLELPKSPLKTADDITVEEVLTHYNAHVKIKSNVEKIRDWYPMNVGSLPLATARIVCQRANCWWDSKLREKYSNFLKSITFVIVFGIVFIGLLSHLTLIEVVLIANGLVPFFRFSVNQSNANFEAAKRLNELVLYAKQVWEEALSKTLSDTILCANSRRLQDEIFEHRSKSPLILDLYYNYFRDEDELLMNRTSEILIAEASDNKPINS